MQLVSMPLQKRLKTRLAELQVKHPSSKNLWMLLPPVCLLSVPTTAVLNGVTQSFKKLISVTIEVEKRLVEINSIFQATDAVFNKFRNSIFQVAKETGQAFGTVAEGAAETGSPRLKC